MNTGPNDNDLKIEIGEVGIEEMLEGLIPGSESVASDNTSQSKQTETENSGIDDPFGW